MAADAHPDKDDERGQMRRMAALMKAFKSNDASSLEVCNFARDIDFGMVAALLECGPSPCGHSSQYAYSEDGGKNIVCLLCERTPSSTPQNDVVDRLHGLLELLAGRFRGYLPWPAELRDAVVRGHEAAIDDTIKRADALLEKWRSAPVSAIAPSTEPTVAWLIVRHSGTSAPDREVVLSPLTDDTFMDEGDEAWPLVIRRADDTGQKP